MFDFSVARAGLIPKHSSPRKLQPHKEHYLACHFGQSSMALLHNPPLLFNFRKQYDCDELSLEHCPGYAARFTERGIPRLVSLFMALMVSSDSTC